MNQKRRSNHWLIMIGILVSVQVSQAQDINLNLGSRHNIPSELLKETRSVLIHLPPDYHKSDQTYPVIYQLDGDEALLLETTAVMNRLTEAEEVMPQCILVAVENTNRARDMWPTNTIYYPEPEEAGAEQFLAFLEQELVPYVNEHFRVSGYNMLCGQSLSAVFTIYAFLERPQLFNAYIASSGAFPACEAYFEELSQAAYRQKEPFRDRILFISNGRKDELDPDGSIHQGVLAFSQQLQQTLGPVVQHRYQTYADEGHVPFQSLYHGLKFVFETRPTQ